MSITQAIGFKVKPHEHKSINWWLNVFICVVIQGWFKLKVSSVWNEKQEEWDKIQWSEDYVKVVYGRVAIRKLLSF